ncbi:unnamed protein product, partial [Rotaria sp. Silwood2]
VNAEKIINLLQFHSLYINHQ